MRCHWLTCVAGLGLAMAGGGLLHAQESQDPRDLVTQARRNLRSSPTDAQRYLRETIAIINMDPLAQQYQKVKIEAFFLLGESYFDVGRIADAVAQFDSVKALASEEDREYKRAEEYRQEIDHLFRPLRIKVKNREIPLLSYIEGIDIVFQFSKRLEGPQIKRLRILQDAQSHKEDEFQFVGIDREDGRPYMEIEYFPVVTFPGRSVGYSLMVENKNKKEEDKRRYRFNFTPTQTGPLEIFWEDDAGWRLVEKVPDDMAKLELPSKYQFRPTQELPVDKYFVREIKPSQHIYLPAESQTELVLQDSEEKTWERIYDITLYVITGAAMLLGLGGAR